jgi:hypothetical protein
MFRKCRTDDCKQTNVAERDCLKYFIEAGRDQYFFKGIVN